VWCIGVFAAESELVSFNELVDGLFPPFRLCLAFQQYVFDLFEVAVDAEVEVAKEELVVASLDLDFVLHSNFALLE
jgi:hypothetical protein